jgi:tRNA1Val (adenine37-N6)-methyltransferase
MANDWFQFKQFLVRQDRTPMKVGTDGVLLGAWAGSGWLLNILDIGTGTGLVALMMAQRFKGARVDAVELDPESAGQAAENIAESPFSDRITVHQADFLTWDPGKKYDLIVCNPPFFKDSLQSPDPGRTVARHDDSLPLADLIRRSTEMLMPNGGLSLILPVGRLPEVAKIAVETGLNLNRILRVKGNPKVAVRRVLIHLDKQYLPVEMGEMTLETEIRGVITEEYQGLIGGFLLEK